MMQRKINRIAACAATVILGGALVHAGGPPSYHYTLAPETDLQLGCFGDAPGGPYCQCAIFLFEDVTGTFALTQNPATGTFDVTDIDWTIASLAHVTGSGAYEVSEEPGGEVLQRLTLELFFDGDGPLLLDSGLVDGGDTNVPPDIAVLVSDGINCGGHRLPFAASPAGGAPADIAPPGGDGLVNTADLLAVLAAWGSAAPDPADIDGSGQVGTGDLLMVLNDWTG